MEPATPAAVICCPVQRAVSPPAGPLALPLPSPPSPAFQGWGFLLPASRSTGFRRAVKSLALSRRGQARSLHARCRCAALPASRGDAGITAVTSQLGNSPYFILSAWTRSRFFPVSHRRRTKGFLGTGGRAEGLLVSYRVSRKSRHLALAACGEGARGLQPRLGLRLSAQSSIQSQLWVLLGTATALVECPRRRHTMASPSHGGNGVKAETPSGTRTPPGATNGATNGARVGRWRHAPCPWALLCGRSCGFSFLVPGRRTRGFARGSQPVNVKDAKCNPDLMPLTSQPGLDQTHCSEWSPS